MTHKSRAWNHNLSAKPLLLGQNTSQNAAQIINSVSKINNQDSWAAHSSILTKLSVALSRSLDLIDTDAREAFCRRYIQFIKFYDQELQSSDRR